MSAVQNVSQISVRRLTNMVDKLGDINAQISRLQQSADDIKITLKDLGVPDVYGNRYRAVISTSRTIRLDTVKVKGMLSPCQIALASVASESTRISLYDL
jgi:hypothetical protein